MDSTTEADDYPERQYVAERARFVITIGALRGALEEQPSERAVRAAGRRWINEAVQAIDEVALQKRRNRGGDQ